MNTLTSPIDLIKKSIEIFFKKENLTFFLKIYIPLFIFSLLQLWRTNNSYTGELEKGNFQYYADKPVLIALFVGIFIVGFVLSTWFYATTLESVIRVVNGGVLELKDAYKKSWKYAFVLLLAGVLTGLSVLLGLVLLIIPGIVFSVWFCFSGFGVAEKGLGAVPSMKESKSLVNGRFWAVLGRIAVFGLFSSLVQILFSFVPFNIGQVVLSLFGALFILPPYLLYKEIRG